MRGLRDVGGTAEAGLLPSAAGCVRAGRAGVVDGATAREKKNMKFHTHTRAWLPRGVTPQQGLPTLGGVVFLRRQEGVSPPG